MLRAIETGRFFPSAPCSRGGSNVRFIAATNRNVELEVQAGPFRRDLMIRLSGITL
jgi:two-component system NtrC family response regulator